MTTHLAVNAERYSLLAIVGFITSFVIPPAGIVLSFIALSRIKRTNEGGRGLAIAGAVVGILAMALMVLFIASTFAVSMSETVGPVVPR